MKKNKNILYAGLLGIALGFSACSDEKTYDFVGDSFNRVYFVNDSKSYKIIQTPISSTSDFQYQASLKCTKNATAEIVGTIEMVPSMVAEYNEKNGTNYDIVPASTLSIENSTLTIPVGSTISTEQIHVSLSENTEETSKLLSKNGYLIPLRITEAKGENTQVSSDVYYAYITLTVIEDNMNHNATESDIVGTLIPGVKNWIVDTNAELNINISYGEIENLIDGDNNTKCYMRMNPSPSNLYLDVDLKKEETFDAVTFYYYAGGRKIGNLQKGMSLLFSNDGSTWRSYGEITSTSVFCVFYAPITARYIRIVKPNTYYITASEFNIYVTK